MRGFVAAKLRHELQPDELGPDSAEWSVDPINEKIVRRKGCQVIQDYPSGNASTVGMLESAWGAKGQWADGVHSPSAGTDYSLPTVLYTDDADKEGTLGWLFIPDRLNNTGSHQQLAQRFSATHYPISGAPAMPTAKYHPKWFADSTTKLGRGINSTQRKYLAAGSRQWLEVGSYLYMPNAYGTPTKWNKRFNYETGSGSESDRQFLWLNLPPLHLGKGQLAAASGTSDNNWKDGDCFFFSVLFEYEDGSLSRPYVPRPAGIVGASGTTIAAVSLSTGATADLRNGQVLVGTVGGSNYFKSITYSALPRGPDGCKYLWLLRSDKVNLASTTTLLSTSPYALSVIARVPNGTTTYVDTSGDNGTLTPDARIGEAFLQLAPPRAQFVIGSDSRVAVGGAVRQAPEAIIIAPVGINALGDTSKADDDSTLYGSTQCFLTVSSTTLALKRVASGGSFPAAVTSTISITLTNKTLQEVVDEINEASSTTRWGAQLAAGVDSEILATNLADTTASDWFGDDAMITAGGTGNMRCFGSTYPGILYFSQTYLATLPVDNQAVLITSASPTIPGGNANSFSQDKSTNWKYPPSATCGRLMGLAPLIGRAGVICLCLYERATYVLRNTISGGSGQDRDYHMVALDEHNGCVASQTIVAGPGVVGWMSPQGYMLSDADTTVCISRDVWDAKLQRGEWSVEMPVAIREASKGTNAHYFGAKLLGSKLCVAYRSDSGLGYANRRLEYEFGEGVDSLGLAGMLKQSDSGRPRPYGWSAPIKTQKIRALGEFRDASGRRFFGNDDTNTGAGRVGDGLIYEIDVGTKDDVDDSANGYDVASYDGTAFTSDAWLTLGVAAPRTLLTVFGIVLRYIKAATGLSVTVYGDGVTNQGARSDSATVSIASSGSNLYGEHQSPVPRGATSALGGQYAFLEAKISDDGSGSSAEVSLLDVDLREGQRYTQT